MARRESQTPHTRPLFLSIEAGRSVRRLLAAVTHILSPFGWITVYGIVNLGDACRIGRYVITFHLYGTINRFPRFKRININIDVIKYSPRSDSL